VFEALDVDNIYRMPIIYHEQGLDARIAEQLGIWTAQPNLEEWNRIIDRLEKPRFTVKVGVVGKYLGVRDSYKSLYEALTHGGIANEASVEIVGLDSEQISAANAHETLSEFDAIIVPGGFGDRGILGKMAAIQCAREKHIPFLGICLGMQLACLEFARNVLKIADANSEEFDPQSRNRIIHLMESQQQVQLKGGSMRLGAYDCVVRRNTNAYAAYGADRISERHRHRYEFNPEFRLRFEENGFLVSGESPDGTLAEMMELGAHPWFLGCQFHPELKSRPTQPHPLFRDLIAAAVKHQSK